LTVGAIHGTCGGWCEWRGFAAHAASCLWRRESLVERPGSPASFLRFEEVSR